MPTESPTSARRIQGLAELRSLAGQELGTSDWLKVNQSMIDGFAEVTGDHQWIHVDVERARRESPFSTTVAHGFLILSLAARLGFDVFTVEGVRLGLNYGLDRVRFTAPVRSACRVRARVTLDAVRDTPKGTLAEFTYAFESDAVAKPVCVAKVLGLFVE
jgi:acyl dehydratase